tara:strand:- start:24381 stop:25817 length:1437 start_codon:yes stop_codon:yes gene_type:complete
LDNKAYNIGAERPREECGVVAVYSQREETSRLAFFGLYALQHRGQESAGIASADLHDIHVHTDMGLVSQVFREDSLSNLKGHLVIGHTRYSTTGSSNPCNAQPILVEGIHGKLALANNGNIINASKLKTQQQSEWNCSYASTTDSEVLAHQLANSPGADWHDRVKQFMRTVQGAYSMVALTKDTLIAARDPLGIRPLCLGKWQDGWIVASETCALDHVGAEFVKELDPGEIVTICDGRLETSLYTLTPNPRRLCVFELIYFARPDSKLDDHLVYSVRKQLGAQLAREHPVDADLVIGVPDSSTSAAVGYSVESGIPFSDGLIKNRYVGRTFIEPEQSLRDIGVRQKFNPLTEVIAGKRLVVVDDSIVRGTTTPHVVNLLKKSGATEVHLRVCAPPIKHPCYMGVDMASREELIASNKSIKEIKDYIKCDSLGYLSVENLLKVVANKSGGFCDACFTGNYPVPVQLEMTKLSLEHTEAR